MKVRTCRCRGRQGGDSSTLFCCFFLFLVVSPPVRGDPGDGGGAHPGREEEEPESQQPDAVERAIGVASGAWGTLWSRAKIALMNLRPPDSGLSRSMPSAGKVVEEAAMRSMETSKSTAEEVAKAVASAAEAAVERTKEKVKRAVSSSSGKGDEEL